MKLPEKSTLLLEMYDCISTAASIPHRLPASQSVPHTAPESPRPPSPPFPPPSSHKSFCLRRGLFSARPCSAMGEPSYPQISRNPILCCPSLR
ncbi:hypothetical protein E2C01_036126 [Portunus trituberculatus]|uniref:Uncharacterized protein n=1 Tax=Portunus trituberculatus TaxID=210409 RepID=A0A5B7FDD1_PORTR|nr:hypothetical protein [Portunus trituberculatus]